MDKTSDPYVAERFDWEDAADFVEDWKVAIGDFILLRPPHGSKEPFWIGRVLSKKRFAGAQGVEFEYWCLMNTSQNPYTGKYVKMASKDIQHVPVYGDAVQDKVRMAFPNGSTRSCCLVRIIHTNRVLYSHSPYTHSINKTSRRQSTGQGCLIDQRNTWWR